MEHTTHSPRRLFLVGLAAIVGLIGTIAIIALALVNSGARENNAVNPDKSTARQIATVDQVQQNLNDLNSSLKQSASDQAKAKAAMNDKQIKVDS